MLDVSSPVKSAVVRIGGTYQGVLYPADWVKVCLHSCSPPLPTID